MKKYIFALSLVFASILANAQIIDNQLLEELSRRSDDEKIEVIVVMKARYDRDALNQKAASYLTRAERRAFVVNELRSFAELSQKDIMDYLGGDAKSLWASNSLCFSATKSQIMDIANRNDVEIIGLSKEYNLIPETGSCKDVIHRVSNREITTNLTQTNVPDVWAQGYTGEGVIVAVIDSGVNYDHLDIADHLWDGGDEFPHHGYDYVNGDDDPMDDMGHGTHCAGTVCGDGTAGSQTGIAPDAVLMCVKSINAEGFGGSVNIAGGMEWAVEHGCDVISMSLGMVNASITDKEVLRRTCVAINDAGVVAAVCAGNEGHIQIVAPVPNNVRVPASCPPPYLDPDQMENPGELSCVIAVGAVDSNDEAAYFTSRGPVTWQDTEFGDYAYNPGIGLIRPDVCGPGVAIKSLDYETVNGYKNLDGTSQATPLVGGIIALMLQKNPTLMPADICRILEETSVKLTQTKSNITGVGRVDALAAVDAVEPYDGTIENAISAFTVYPNPANNFVYINDSSIETRFIASHIEVLDIRGQLMEIQVKNNQIDISNLPNGIYFIKLGEKISKLVIER